MEHTKEPWPPFIDICEPSTPHPDSELIVRLSLDGYYRAKVCVNACAGLSDAVVSHGLVPASQHSTVAHQRDQLLAALSGLVDDIQGLMSESDGVAGLHPNGDLAPWSELEAGGRFERLSHLPAAVAAIAAVKGPAA